MFSLPATPSPFLSIYPLIFRFWRAIIKHVQIPAFFLSFLVFIPSTVIYDVFLYSKRHLLTSIPFAVFYLLSMAFLTMTLMQANAILKNIRAPSYFASFLVGIIKIPALVIGILIAVICTGVGSLIFLLPGLYIFFITPLYIQLVVLEKKNPFKIFNECLDLVYGHWWRTFFVVYIPVFIFSLIFHTLDLWLKMKWVILVNHVPLDAGILLTKTVLGALYFPFFISVTLIQLYDLSLRQKIKTQN